MFVHTKNHTHPQTHKSHLLSPNSVNTTLVLLSAGDGDATSHDSPDGDPATRTQHNKRKLGRRLPQITLASLWLRSTRRGQTKRRHERNIISAFKNKSGGCNQIDMYTYSFLRLFLYVHVPCKVVVVMPLIWMLIFPCTILFLYANTPLYYPCTYSPL